MFCGSCGTPNEGTRFCTKCGSLFQGLGSDSTTIHAPQDNNGRGFKTTLPDIKLPSSIRKKATMASHSAGELPLEYAWLKKTVDVVLASNAVVIVASAPVNRFTRAADNVALAGMAGGLAGGVVVSLPASMIGAAYEGVFGQHNKFDKASLQALFDSGNAVWINASSAKFYFIEIKAGLFGDVGCLFAVVGDFETANGKTRMCISSSDGVFPIASELRKQFKIPGYPFNHITVKNYAELMGEFDKLLMANFPESERFRNN